MKVLGIVLILFGVFSLAYGGITYTKQEQVHDAGPIEARVDKQERVPLPPVAGGVSLLAGMALILVHRRGS